MDMTPSDVFASGGLIPVEAEDSAGVVDNPAVLGARTPCLVFAVPEAREFAEANAVTLSAEAYRAGGE